MNLQNKLNQKKRVLVDMLNREPGIGEEATLSDELKNSIWDKYQRFINKKTTLDLRSDPNRNRIIADTFNFENYFRNLINTTKTVYSRRRRKKQNKSELKYPWFVVDLSNGGVYFIPLHVPGIAAPGGLWWQIGWRGGVNGTPNNLTRYPFPTAYMYTNRGVAATNYLKYQNVGAFCAQEVNKNLCNQNYKQVNLGGQVYGIRANGTASLGVKELVLAISSAPTGGLRRRYFLDFKRNGDWGQIFTCYYLNKYPAKGILKPGSWKVAEELFNSGNKLRILTKLKNNFNFFYKNCTFWTNDRLACFLAYILGVPVVYQKSSRVMYYGHRTFNDPLPEFPNSPVLNELIIKNFNNQIPTTRNYINHPNNSTKIRPDWLLYLAVLDTAHDFGKKTSRTNVGVGRYYQFKEKIINLIKGIRPDPTFERNVNSLFTDIGGHENRVGEYLVANMDPPKSAEYINFKLIQQESCIVFDTGKGLPEILQPFIALLSAKYTDPAS